MAPFHTTVLAFAAAGVFATVVADPQVCSSQIHCEEDGDHESELQSVSMLQKDTVFIKAKAKQAATMRTMAELTPSGEAVAVSEDEPPPSEGGTVSVDVTVHGLQQHVVAEPHRLHAAVERAEEVAAKTMWLPGAKNPDHPHSQVRSVPLAETVSGAHARRKTRRALPGVSLLGRMSSTVARHGLHAAHTAGAIPHAPHPHEETAETMLVAVCLFLFAIFSMGCLVLEHRSKDRAQAHANQYLTRTLDGPAVDSSLQVPADVRQLDSRLPVGAAIAAPPADPPCKGSNFSVGLEVFADASVGLQRADAFEILDHAGHPFCTVTLSDTPNGARCLALTCNGDEDRNCCVIAPPDAAAGLQVFGFKGKLHGVAHQDSSQSLSLRCEGQPSAVVEGLKDETLQQTVFAPSGAVLASSRRDPEAWAVRVEPESDEVLAIVLLLARVLLVKGAVGTGPVQVA